MKEPGEEGTVEHFLQEAASEMRRVIPDRDFMALVIFESQTGGIAVHCMTPSRTYQLGLLDRANRIIDEEERAQLREGMAEMRKLGQEANFRLMETKGKPS
jgi:bifunctional pyridoxal-dependent enzyme with beta-cystathionase and maltose regulon repressor activities